MVEEQVLDLGLHVQCVELEGGHLPPHPVGRHRVDNDRLGQQALLHLVAIEKPRLSNCRRECKHQAAAPLDFRFPDPIISERVATARD